MLDAWAQAPTRIRVLLGAAGVLAIALLWGFYAVVSGAVHRAESGREQARVAFDRQVVCSAFSTTSARDLCGLTIATDARQPVVDVRKSVVHAVYEPAPATVRNPHLTAALN